MELNDNSNQVEESSSDSSITIRLEGFEGPLDLLLHLIKKEELDIWDIPIARVTEQYLEYLQVMKDLNVNVAGEWLVMAATLIQIKSRLLLPPDPDAAEEGETVEDPRTELVYQLLEHQKFKNAAQMLFTREEVENAVWNKPPKEILDEEKGVIAITIFDLLKAFHEVIKRFEDQTKLEMAQEEISMDQMLEEIRRMLLIQESILFASIFENARSKQHLIVAFLALLELVRLREICILQKQTFGDIHIKRLKNAVEKA